MEESRRGLTQRTRTLAKPKEQDVFCDVCCATFDHLLSYYVLFIHRISWKVLFWCVTCKHFCCCLFSWFACPSVLFIRSQVLFMLIFWPLTLTDTLIKVIKCSPSFLCFLCIWFLTLLYFLPSQSQGMGLLYNQIFSKSVHLLFSKSSSLLHTWKIILSNSFF